MVEAIAVAVLTEAGVATAAPVPIDVRTGHRPGIGLLMLVEATSPHGRSGVTGRVTEQ
jgi:hypothetical protein